MRTRHGKRLGSVGARGSSEANSADEPEWQPRTQSPADAAALWPLRVRSGLSPEDRVGGLTGWGRGQMILAFCHQAYFPAHLLRAAQSGDCKLF